MFIVIVGVGILPGSTQPDLLALREAFVLTLTTMENGGWVFNKPAFDAAFASCCEETLDLRVEGVGSAVKGEDGACVFSQTNFGFDVGLPIVLLTLALLLI